MMRSNRKQSFSPQTPKSIWNCYPAYNTKNELFLTNNQTHYDKRGKDTTFKHQRKESEITYKGPLKVSLKNKRESRLNHTVRTFKEDANFGILHQIPQTSIPMMRPLIENRSQQSLIWQSRSPIHHVASRVQFQPTQHRIVVTPTASIKFASLNPPPTIQFYTNPLKFESKQQETSRIQQLIQNKNKERQCQQTTIGASNSQSLKDSQKDKEDRLKQYRFELKLPEKCYKVKDFQYKKIKEVRHNPQPQLLSPVEPKQPTSKSLMTDNKIYCSQGQQNGWQRAEPVRSFCSEKNIRKVRIQRMSQVQQIKSQPDSDQISNCSDNQSIVLGRLQQLQSLFNPKQLQGSSIPYSKINPSNSSIQIRDSQ